MSKQSDLVNIAQGDTITVDHANGRVGIGTSSPNEPLHVIGTVRSETSSTGDFNFYATSTGGGAYRIYPDDATTANPTWLHQSNSSEDQAWVIGGVERMRIDNEGRVTTPYQPAFAVSKGTTTGAVNTTITISSASVDLNVGSHFNNTNGRFTAPVSGVYLFSFYISRNTQSGNTPRIDLLVNGSYITRALVYNTSYSSGTISWIAQLTTGDYAEAVVVGVNGGTPDFYGAYFSGYLLG